MTDRGAPTVAPSTAPEAPVVTPSTFEPVPPAGPAAGVAAPPVVTPATFSGATSVTQSSTPAIVSSEKLGESATTKLRMQIVVSLAVLAAALFVLLSKNYDEAYIKWAIGTIGIVVGYWLR